MKKLIIILFLSNPLFAQGLQPLKNYTFGDVAENEEVNYLIIEGCVSLYSAITELTKICVVLFVGRKINRSQNGIIPTFA